MFLIWTNEYIMDWTNKISEKLKAKVYLFRSVVLVNSTSERFAYRIYILFNQKAIYSVWATQMNGCY